MTNKENALALIKGAKKIGLVSHVRMDLDSYGSIFGLREILRGLGKEVVIFSAEEIATFFLDFDPKIEYELKSEYEHIDLLIITDVSSLDRIAAPNIVPFVRNIPAIVIDHHATEPKVEENYVYIIEQAAAASEIIYTLLKEWNFQINKKAASYLCLGILDDTNDRQFANTTEETKEIIEEILKNYGQDIYERYLEAREKDRSHKRDFFEHCFKKAIKSKKYDATVAGITTKDLEKFGMTNSIGSQFANYIEDYTESAAFVFTEIGENKIKASMRSNKNKLNVREIAESFGGGGHDLAAGFVVEGALKTVVDKFL